jgi:hypothetical protein
MDVLYVTAYVRAISGRRRGFEGNFRIDARSIDCKAPASNLKAVGIKQEGKKACGVDDGKRREWSYGFARLSFLGCESVTQIIFGPEDCAPTLGLVALENAGIVVDPKTKILRRLPALPLK